jgi:formylglycine-generating enzyme required for sulfatase activity
MDAQFIAIVQKLLAEQGRDTLHNTLRFKSLLAGYTGTEYKRERRLFMQAVEAGIVRAISSTHELEACKKQQVKMLQEEYFIVEEAAVDVVDTLVLVLKSGRPGAQMLGKHGRTVAAVSKKSAPSGMIWIASGTFMMGSPHSEAGRRDDETRHQVTISKGFYMGNYEVTQAEYQAVMGNNPSDFKGIDLPVENVSWYDAVEYCNKRSQQERLRPAYTISGSGDRRNVTWDRNANGYRLPTEAEWEYACRAGTTSPFSTGSNITTEQANYDGNYPYNGNATKIYREGTTAVGSFAANRWGLYDMHGNVWEWCWDWFGSYSSGLQTDPTGADSGVSRVNRGGSWYIYAQYLRSAYRLYENPSIRNSDLGFRLVHS